MPEYQKLTTVELGQMISNEIKKGNHNIIIQEKDIIDNCKIRLSAYYNKNIYSSISLTFHRCIFNEQLEIEAQFSQGTNLNYDECLFKKNIFIHDSTIELKIENCRILNNLNISTINGNNIQINNISSFKDIVVTNCSINNLTILKSNSYEESNIFLFNNHIINYNLNHLNVKQISFIENKTECAILFNEINITKELYFSRMSLSKLSINDFDIKHISFYEVILKYDLTLNIDDGGILNIFDFGKCQSISIKKCQFTNFSINGSHLEKPFKDEKPIIGRPIELELGFSTISKGNIFIDNLNINKLFIYGNNNDTNISIQNCEATDFKAHKFINKNTLYLTNFILNKKSTISITNSYLGQTFFTNIDFRFVKYFFVRLTQFTDIKSNNVFWPSDIKTDNYIDKKSIYRQLKSAMLSQNDKIQAFEFESKEMDAYRMEVGNMGKWQDKLILWASSTNDFGQNWWKAIKYLIRAALIFHLSAILFINWGSSDFYLVELYDKIEAIAYYFNPIHTTKDLWAIYNSSSYPDYEVIADWFYFFDFLARIVTGFFYFQIVRAFRKYAR